MEPLALVLARPQHRANIRVAAVATAAAAAAAAAAAVELRGRGHRRGGAGRTPTTAITAVPSASSGVGPCPAFRRSK